jgi:parvulin-like peptidyl-prolyl isomerase
MMQRMREGTKVILWVVVIAFVITIFAVWGLDLQSGSTGQKQSEVGRVNGVPVSAQTYQQIYSQLAQQFRAQGSGELSAAQQELVREQAWDNIVSNIITGEEIKKLGIGVTDDEVLAFLRKSPPPEVQQYFKRDDGTFDYAAYQAALNNPEADWTAVEELARQRIPVLKLNTYLMAQVHVSAAEIGRAYEEENVKLIAEYVEFPIDAEDVGDRKPSDADVQAYYDAHKDQFQDMEKASLEYVRVPIAPSPRDRSDLLFSAAQIRNDAIGGGDFAGVAKTYSEAQTATVGGETGLLDRTQRDEAVMKAVDSLKPGEISEPIPTPDGVYVVQLIETKKEKGATKYNLREIFIRLSAGSATVDSLTTIAQDIHQRVTEGGDLAAAAKAHGLEVQSTGPFGRGVIPGLGFVPAVTRFAFTSEASQVSGVLSDDRNLFVCRAGGRTPATARPLADVADVIRQDLVRQHKLELAKRKAEGFRKTATLRDVPFARAAAQYGYRVAKTDSFTVYQPPTGMQPQSEFARGALASDPGAVGGPIESGNSVYVIHLLGRASPSSEVFKSRMPALLQQLRDQKIQTYVMYWYNALKEKSKIEDFRQTL